MHPQPWKLGLGMILSCSGACCMRPLARCGSLHPTFLEGARRKNILESLADISRFDRLAFPDDSDAPSRLTQGLLGELVPLHIAEEFFAPKLSIGRGKGRLGAARVHVPETPVNEESQF